MPKKIGGIIMLSKIRALKEKKGFTLVELIVVLVILAILAALLIPALTGYIDKARKQSIVAETRQVVMAAQTTVSEIYGTTKGDVDGTKLDKDAILKLADVPAGGVINSITVGKTNDSEYNGTVTAVSYTRNGYTCIYDQATSTYTFTK